MQVYYFCHIAALTITFLRCVSMTVGSATRNQRIGRVTWYGSVKRRVDVDRAIRIAGRVVYARPDRGVGVRIEDVERDRYAQLIAVPPPVRR